MPNRNTNGRPQRQRSTKAPVATYKYRNNRGKLIFSKERYDPKDFRYRLPNGRIVRGYELAPLLYRLPDLIAAAKARTVFIAEGEKDCDRLAKLGFVATCNYDGGGKGKWLPAAYNRYFRGRHVVILPDNDKTGQTHAIEIAASLVTVAASVKIVELPNQPAKGDVSDWLTKGHTARSLAKLADDAPTWRPKIELEPVKDRFSDEWELRAAINKVLNRSLKPQAKLVLIILYAKISKPRPTQKTIAAAVGVSPGRIKKILADLRKRGLISARKRGHNIFNKHGRENEYSVRGL